MGVYVLLPMNSDRIDDQRFFASYSSAEQVALRHARALVKVGQPAKWCYIVLYDGVDELEITYVYCPSPDGRSLLRSSLSPLES